MRTESGRPQTLFTPRRKDIELLRSGFRAARLLTRESQSLCSTRRDAVIASCLPFAFAPQTPLRASFRQLAITAVGSDRFA